MTSNKIPLTGIGLTNLCVLRPGDPPIDFPQLGFATPAHNQTPVQAAPRSDPTYWQYQDWQPS